jgi:hypothetical protein
LKTASCTLFPEKLTVPLLNKLICRNCKFVSNKLLATLLVKVKVCTLSVENMYPPWRLKMLVKVF